MIKYIKIEVEEDRYGMPVDIRYIDMETREVFNTNHIKLGDSWILSFTYGWSEPYIAICCCSNANRNINPIRLFSPTQFLNDNWPRIMVLKTSSTGFMISRINDLMYDLVKPFNITRFIPRPRSEYVYITRTYVEDSCINDVVKTYGYEMGKETHEENGFQELYNTTTEFIPLEVPDDKPRYILQDNGSGGKFLYYDMINPLGGFDELVEQTSN